MKRVLSLFFLLFSVVAFSQGNQQWGSYFSYSNIQDISQSANRIFAASESAMFIHNDGTNELKTITSVDGLKAETITAIYHSATFGRTLVGNINGLLIVVNNDGSIINKVDIIEETTVPAIKKKINHIYEFDGKAYIATDFGISVMDLSTLEFGDTYFLGPNGAEVSVRQTAVHNGYIYACTFGSGIRRGLLANPNLNDFSQWVEEFSFYWYGVVSFSGKLFGAYQDGLYRLENGANYLVASLPSPPVDLREANGYMIVTCPNRINVYNEALQQVFQLNLIPGEEVTFTCATVVGGQIFIGTAEKGVFVLQMNNISVRTNITPNGPLRSNIFSLEKSPGYLWAVFGDYDATYNPHPLEQYGISRLSETGWESIPNSDLFNASSISDIEASPADEKLVYAASYHSGLIKINDFVPEILYDYTNTGTSGLQSLSLASVPSYRSVRVNALAFDRNNNLWMTNSNISKPLKVLKSDNQWASYSFEGAVADILNEDYSDMVIDRNNTKWIASERNGVIAFNENLSNKLVVIKGEESNLPIDNIKSVAIDNNNRLWIGTTKGLRVLSSVERFMTEDELSTNSIIIIEDGLAQELMYEQVITDILVDGANNKWIGTAGAGAFLVSPDGQKTLFHFTKENSPLPSNNINDIEIDDRTGEVFFATDRGMVSYKGTSTEAAGDLSKVYVFPNPVRPGFDGDVNISGLVDSANIKITDIEGNLVYETTSEGGTVLWDTRAFGKHKVASGVYMIFIASEDGTETKVKKVMVIR